MLGCLILLFICFHFDKNRFCRGNASMLIKKLFTNYNKNLIPMKNHNQTLRVELNPALFNIVESNKEKGELIFVHWLRMLWQDENLSWNPAEYNGIFNIKIPRSQIWIPDVFVINMVNQSDLLKPEQLNVNLNSSGFLLISIPQLVKLHCVFDLKMFPFDTQNCSIHFGSWMFDKSEMELFPTNPPDIRFYKSSPEWGLINYTFNKLEIPYGGSNERFIDLFYYIKIKRRPEYYLMIFFLPTFIITTLSIVGVYSPFNETAERVEKVSMGMTTLLSMAIILLIVSDQMPKTSTDLKLPLLGNYIMLEISLSAIATIGSVFVLQLNRKTLANESVPNWLLLITLIKRDKNIKFLQKLDGPQRSQTEREEVEQNDPIQEIGKMQLYKDISTNMNKAIELLREIKQHYFLQGNLDLWGQICCRIDLYLMIIFLVINTLLVVYFIVSGFSHNDMYSSITVAR